MFDWNIPLEAHDLKGLAWLAEELTHLSENSIGPPDMRNYPEVDDGEHTIETRSGPLVAPESVRILERLLVWNDAELAHTEWLDSNQRAKASLFIRALI